MNQAKHSSVGVMIAPNGARLTPDDHPAIPVTVEALVETVVGCAAEGARAVHLHTRDAQFKHVLDAEQYKHSISLLRNELGRDFPIQVTTEAIGLYSQQEQIDLVMEVKPEFVSVAIMEMCGDNQDLHKARDFYHWCSVNQVAVQHILYCPEEIDMFFDLKARAVLPQDHHSVLFVLGRYTKDQQSDPTVLDGFLECLHKHDPSNALYWTLCAFGVFETECLVKAAQNGGHIRVGFENNRLNSDGKLAKNNEERVTLLYEELRLLNIDICDTANMRRVLGAGH